MLGKTNARLNGTTNPGTTAEVTQAMIDAWDTNARLNGTTDPGTSVVAEVTQEMITAWGNNQTLGGVAGSTNPGTSVVDITDVETFMTNRLDDRGEDYFSNNSITAQGLLAATSSEIAAHKTAMTSVDAGGIGADG